MFIRIILVTLCCSVLAHRNYKCNKHSAIMLLKRPAYEFSMKLFQHVAEESDSHFVFSPMTTWLQLTALAEGATGETLREIWRVTKHPRNKCFRKKLKDILNVLNADLKNESKRKSVIAIDELLAVNKTYIKTIEKIYGIDVLLLNFNDGLTSAAEVNHAIEEGTGGAIDRILYQDDFDSTVMLLSDANYFRSEWRTQFNTENTKTQPFYLREGIEIGEVSMMNQIGYFNMLEIPHIQAKVLELPLSNDRISMLIFLPTDDIWVRELFYNLERTTLTSIFNMFKEDGGKLVNVSIPKFMQWTAIPNLPELISDMYIKTIFDPKLAKFRKISKYTIYTSFMTQICKIEVNERGLSAESESLAINDTANEFLANKPFAYLIFDKLTDFILYGGIYSNPNVY